MPTGDGDAAGRALEETFRLESGAAVATIQPDYQPWFSPLWEPPSSEVESLLFALQAALGSGLLGYYLGLRRGQSQRRKQEQDSVDAGD